MDYKTDKILLNQEIERKKDILVVEDSIIIPDINPDVLSIIDTSSNLFVYKKELSKGKIRIDGGIKLDTIYTADDEKNSTRAIHNSLDFSKVIDIKEQNIENSNFSCTLSVKNIDSKIINGRKISIKASIEYELTIYSDVEFEYISQIDDINVQKIGETFNISTIKNRGETICNAKDTITLGDSVSDILSTSISVRNKEQKVSYNKILSKAECIIDFIYMNEENQIEKYQEQIPIMGFIDIPGVSDDELNMISYEMRSINIKPDSIDNKSILIDIEFFVSCDVYERKSINIIQDLYSPEEEITINQQEVDLFQNRDIVKSLCNINERINISDVKSNNIYITNISKNNISQKILGDSIYYEGSISVDFIFESKITNRIELRSQSIDFSHSVKLDVNTNTEVNSDFEICDVEIQVNQNEEAEVKIEMYVIINKSNKMHTNLINNLKIEGIEQNKRQNSLIIYYVKEGDTLWKIAKKFKTTIDEIVEVNGIENENKLEIGEQLFIPRHVCKCAC